ncbi:MAG: TIGR01620 family protein [Hyphomicrobiales bacterium]|nr:MAG: TIGR01620 family protein [Hyphomicrobiales bacterium]
MKRPVAIPLDGADKPQAVAIRTPRAFLPDDVEAVAERVESLSDAPPDPETIPVPPRKASWLARILWTTAGLLVSLALGLAADSLIRSLFDTSTWLGYIGLGVLGLFLVALVGLIIRETAALWRLRSLDHLKGETLKALASDRLRDAQPIVGTLKDIYATRPDMSRALTRLKDDEAQFFDGSELLRYSERTLMAPLDARARTLTAASARRVALVTAVSPRALVDVAFVIWESIRLGGAIARLYGARPGFWSSWRLVGAILGHLAVTGGLVLTDGVVEQLVGQGLAAKLSQRLGEGVVNGLMTVRVGIAAMRVVRPLPFTTEPQPVVKDFLPELANVLKSNEKA